MRTWPAKVGRRLLQETRGGVVENLAIWAGVVVIALTALGIIGSAIKDRAEVIQTQIESVSEDGFQNP